MNTELGRQLKEFILQHPDELNMCSWDHCLAGWTVKLAGINTSRMSEDNRIAQSEFLAAWALRMPSQDLLCLFHVLHWPEPYQSLYRSAETFRGKAQAAAEYLEAFIQEQETGDAPTDTKELIATLQH